MKLMLLITMLGMTGLQTAQPQRGLAQTATPAALCGCSIEVTVQHPDGSPISNVQISVNGPVVLGQSQPAPEPAALMGTTDASGRAMFLNLKEDSYGIRAERDGYFDSIINGVAKTDSTAAVTVGTAAGRKPRERVTIRMIEGATVSGRIYDGNHRPASGVEVQALQLTYPLGVPTLRQVGIKVQTDDLGAYRLFWFGPGEYYIRATSPLVRATRSGGPNFPSFAYLPGTVDPERSTPVVLQEGQQYSGADVEMQPVRGVTISGTVVNTVPNAGVLSNGQLAPSNFSFFMAAHDSSVLEPPQSLPNLISANGLRATANNRTDFPFEIRGVPPGEYEFYAVLNGPPGSRGRGNSFGGAIGRTIIEVGSENVTGVRTVVQAGVDVKGQLRLIGIPPADVRPQVLPLQLIRLQVRPVDNRPISAGIQSTSLIASDVNGNFTLPGLAEGRYQIAAVSGIPADAFVADIRQGTRNIYNDGILTITKESQEPLEIVIGRGGSTVQWTLVDAQRNPAGSGQVFLIPDPPRRLNLLLFKGMTNINVTGTFAMTGVAPGSYKLFAWSSVPTGAEMSGAFIQRYDELGTHVVVSAGMTTTTVQVPLISGNR